MTDLLTYINVTLLGLKPFHLNLFKTGTMALCLLMGVWVLVSRSGFQRIARLQDGIEQWSDRQHRTLAWCLGGLFAAFLMWLRTRQYFELQTMWDMTTETNVAWHMVHGPWFFNSLDNRSHLGQHMSPVFFLIGMVYGVAEHPLTLLAIQSLALGLGAVAVHELAWLRCGTRSVALFAMALYIFNPYLHHSNAHDFHRSPLAIPAILWLLLGIESGRRVLAVICTSLALSIEEGIPLPLAGLGLYLAAFRPAWRPFGLGLTVLSVGYFILATKVLLPMFNPERGLFFWERYANLGGNLNDALTNIVRHPIWALGEALVRHDQYVYLLYFFIPVAFLPLLAWREATLMIIPLASMLLSQHDGQYKLGFHYSAPALPFLFYSSVCGLCVAIDWVHRKSGDGDRRWRAVLAGFLFLMGLNTYRSPGYDLGKTDPQFASTAFVLAARIPVNAAIATDVRFAPLFANRHRICKLGVELGTVCDWNPVGATVWKQAGDPAENGRQQNDPQWLPEYVLVGAEPNATPKHKLEQQQVFLRWLMNDLGYEIIANQAGIALLRAPQLYGIHD